MPFDQVSLPGTQMRDVVAGSNGQAYRIFVAVPKSEPPPDGYPVLYMLDANSSFATMAQTMAVLSIWRDGTGVQPTLIVGIGYPTDDAFDAARRGFDYTPAPEPGGPELVHAHRLSYPMGGAEPFLAFITAELKPLIESEYHVDRGRQALFGHSFGGLFTLYALFTRPNEFRSYVAASPSLAWGQPVITTLEERFAAAADHGHVRLLITAGEFEQKLNPWERDLPRAAETEAYYREFRMIDRARALIERLNALRRPQLEARLRVFEGEGHMSLVPTAASHSLRFVAGTL